MRLQGEMFVVEQICDKVVTLKLNAGHTIYKSHFPGNPITPGVCVIQIIAELLMARLQTQLVLNRIVNLKFVAPISPVKCPVIDVVFSQIADDVHEVKTKGTIVSGESIYTKFSLIFDKNKES